MFQIEILNCCSIAFIKLHIQIATRLMWVPQAQAHVNEWVNDIHFWKYSTFFTYVSIWLSYSKFVTMLLLLHFFYSNSILSIQFQFFSDFYMMKNFNLFYCDILLSLKFLKNTENRRRYRMKKVYFSFDFHSFHFFQIDDIMWNWSIGCEFFLWLHQFDWFVRFSFFIFHFFVYLHKFLCLYFYFGLW